ncbi:MAG: UrcA family protein [Pseudomonadota bacterium]
MTRFLPTVAKFAAASLVAASFASTAIADDVVSYDVTIRFDEAQLSTPYGAATVLGDLSKQAEDACSFVEPILRTERVDAECAADVVRQAVISINNTALTEAYNIAEGSQISPTLRAANAETTIQ